MLLALVNCDVGRSDGDTDDDTQQAGVVANIEEDKTPDTATKAETVSSPNANVSNVSSTGKPVPGSKPKEDEGGNKDANTGTNDNDGDEDHSEDSDDASQPDHKLTEADLKKTPSTNTTGEAKPNEINDNQPDTPNTSTQKSDTDSTPKDKTSTKSITSTTISTSTSTRTTTSTTSTTTTTTKESGDEGEDVYTDDEDITNGKTKDDPQADTNVVSETTTSKATGKTKDLEPVSVLEDEDEAKIEADLKTQNYFMVSARFEYGTLF